MEQPEPFKLLLVGNAGVGKTSLLNRLNGDAFSDTNQDWDVKRINISFNGVTRVIILTDTAGQERFRELTSASYKSVDCVFIVYSIDDKASFSDVENWVKQVDLYVSSKSVPRIIIANKVDLDERQVSTEEGEAYAKSKGMRYLETSAKTDKNVQEIINMALTPQKPEKEGGGCCILQ